MSRKKIIECTARLGPLSAKQISFELGIARSTVHDNIQRARAYGTRYLRIADWVGVTPLYAPGPGEDVESARVEDRVLAWLQDGNVGHTPKIAKELGLTRKQVSNIIRRLWEKNQALQPRRRFMHIYGWFRPVGRGGRECAIYKAGPGEDAPRPDFSDRTEYDRRYEQKRAVRERMRVAPRPRAAQARHPVGNVFAALMPQMGA